MSEVTLGIYNTFINLYSKNISTYVHYLKVVLLKEESGLQEIVFGYTLFTGTKQLLFIYVFEFWFTFTSCVTLSKSLNFSVSVSPSVKWR